MDNKLTYIIILLAGVALGVLLVKLLDEDITGACSPQMLEDMGLEHLNNPDSTGAVMILPEGASYEVDRVTGAVTVTCGSEACPIIESCTLPPDGDLK